MSGKSYGLVLEGGALRGLFTAGVLDYFMEKNLKFPYIIGVSAGACNAISYISGQAGRTRKSMMHEGEPSYYGSECFRSCGKFFNLDITFDEYPYKQYPFDFKSYFASDTESEYVVTDITSGSARYLSGGDTDRRLIDTVKASSSLPLITNPVFIDGIPYLDGGIAEPIPVKRAFLQGCKKCVVILTKPEGYVAKTPVQTSAAAAFLYRKYPGFVKAYEDRSRVYASRLKLIEYLERAGMAYVIRPSIHEIDRLEADRGRLNEYYTHGYEKAENKYEEMIHFIGEDKVLFDD